MKHIKRLIAFTGFLLTLGCNGLGNQAGSGQYDYSVIETGVNSSILDERFVMFRDQDSFKSMWMEHHSASPAEMPALDFQNNMVIGAFAGSKPSGGYQLEITEIKEDQANLAVVLQLKQPDAGCMVSSVMTQPYVIALTKWSKLPVKFKVLNNTYKCE